MVFDLYHPLNVVESVAALMITAVILSAASGKVLAEDTSACNCENFKEVVEVQQEEISSLHKQVIEYRDLATSQQREITSVKSEMNSMKETLSTLVNVVSDIYNMPLDFCTNSLMNSAQFQHILP